MLVAVTLGAMEATVDHRLNVSPGSSTFFKVAPAGKPVALTLVPSGTSSDGKPFFLEVKSITLRVFE